MVTWDWFRSLVAALEPRPDETYDAQRSLALDAAQRVLDLPPLPEPDEPFGQEAER